MREEEKTPCQDLHVEQETEVLCSHPERIDVFNKAVCCCILIPLGFQKQLSGRKGCRETKQDLGQLWLLATTQQTEVQRLHLAGDQGSGQSKWRVLGTGRQVRSTFGDVEFHFTLKSEDMRKLSTSLLPPLSSL